MGRDPLQESSLDIFQKHSLPLAERSRTYLEAKKKPAKLSASQLGMLVTDIQKSGYRLQKPIAGVVSGILADHNRGYIDPEKHFPHGGTYEGAVRLVNLVLHTAGLDTIKSLGDPLLKRPSYPKSGG